MNAIRWGGDSATDPRFSEIVKDWIQQDGEVYVMLWFIKAAGAKGHYWVNSFEQFQSILASTKVPCSVDVYRHPQFPLRGFVDNEFISYAVTAIDDGDDWFLLVLEKHGDWWKTLTEGQDNSHESLVEALTQHAWGKYVIIGPDIHWPVPPHDYPGEWVSGNLNETANIQD